MAFRPTSLMSTVRFGAFELDLATSELRRAGRVVPLERQPAVTLALLASRPGRLVPREDLRRALWPSDVHVDFDRGLNYCIRQVRAALGDEAKTPRFIETVPRQGYRFVAAVHAPAGSRPARPAVRFRLRTFAAAALVALVLGGLAWDRMERDPSRSARHHAAAVSALQAVHDLVF